MVQAILSTPACAASPPKANENQVFLDFSSSFLRRLFTSSETDLYPSSGCSFTSFSTSSKSGFGILAELYCGIEDIYMYKNKNVDVTYMWQYSNRCMCLEHICNIGVAL